MPNDNATQEDRTHHDAPPGSSSPSKLARFLKENCQKAAGERTPIRSLRDAFRQWLYNEGYDSPKDNPFKTTPKLLDGLVAEGLTTTNPKNVAHVKGLVLLDEGAVARGDFAIVEGGVPV